MPSVNGVAGEDSVGVAATSTRPGEVNERGVIVVDAVVSGIDSFACGEVEDEEIFRGEYFTFRGEVKDDGVVPVDETFRGDGVA
jgi:hypothetical protein